MWKKGGAGCLRGKEAKGVDCEYTLPSQRNRVINLVEKVMKKLNNVFFYLFFLFFW
jgi:hypothetical protein